MHLQYFVEICFPLTVYTLTVNLVLLNTICRTQLLCPFYPTALEGCRGTFTHGVQMGGQAGGDKKFVRAVSQKPYGVGSSYLVGTLVRGV